MRLRALAAIAALPTPAAAGLAVATIAGLFVIDYATGPEVAFSVFYLVPVAIGAWSHGVALGLPLALVSATAWLVADLLAGTGYSHPLIAAWNTTTRFTVFVVVAALLSELHRSREHERELANTDALTGLASSRSFMQQASLEVQLSRRYGRTLALVYVDLDDFKQVNDEQGHNAGDAMLLAVARHLRRQTRDTDLVARLGGDEFAILLRETSSSGTQALVASLPMRVGGAGDGRVIGFSIGAVTFERPPGSVDEMIGEADRLMYLVKRAGKGSSQHRVVQPVPHSAAV